MTDNAKELFGQLDFDVANELVASAASAENAEEIAAIAKNSGIDLSLYQAQTIFDELNAEVELSMGDLEAAAGGILWSCDDCN